MRLRRNHYSLGKIGQGRSRSALLATCLSVGLGLYGANALAQSLVVNCPGGSIQTALNSLPPAVKSATIFINGTCAENVRVISDNVKFFGGAAGTVSGTITVDGARRVVFQNLTITGPGHGIVGTSNAALEVTNSRVSGNDEDGIVLTDGANGEITKSLISNNGQAKLNFEQGGPGVGIQVENNASAVIKQNKILDNRSDGVGVSDGAFALVEENTIMRNGRASAFEAGVDVYRGRVRANGNVYANNPYAAIEVGNFGEYRTGSFLNSSDALDSPFPFEQINRGTGQVAVDLYNKGYMDLRQVNIRGDVLVGHHTMLQLRGDDVGPNTRCSTIDGNVDVYGTFAVVRFRHTHVNGSVDLAPDARLVGEPVCP